MAKDAKTQLRALLKDFQTGMLVTRTVEGALHARPMAVARLEADGDLFFATSVESGKIGEIEREHQVAVTFQSAHAFVSVCGIARVIHDRSRIDAYWGRAMRLWFPKGKGDPALCLLALHPMHAEYWNMQGMRGLKFVVEAAKAYVQGRTPARSLDLHGRIDVAQ